MKARCFYLKAWTKLLRTFAKLRKTTISFVTSVRPPDRREQNGSHWMDFHEIWYLRVCSKNLTRKYKFRQNVTWKTSTLHEDVGAYTIISRSVHLRMRNVSDKNCRENQNTHFAFSKLFFSENRTVYEIKLENMVQTDRPQTTT